jgi:hypothetical protein
MREIARQSTEAPPSTLKQRLASYNIADTEVKDDEEAL